MTFEQLSSTRVLRVPLSVEIIREIDDAIRRGAGGFQDREELISEAVVAYLVELKYGIVTPGSPATQPSGGVRPVASDAWDVAPGRLVGLGNFVTLGDGSTEAIGCARGPLFGLHNRDYASIWAAWQLAEMTRSDTIPYSDYLKLVVAAAWKAGAELRALTAALGGPKQEALFPTNIEKAASSEDAFRAFAIGSATIADGKPCSSGPLFLWGICALEIRSGELHVALTTLGEQLLRRLDGIGSRMPHEQRFAIEFLEHLRKYAAEDWWGFKTIIAIAGRRPTRQEMLDGFRAERERVDSKWTDHQVTSYATGYTSRCREWGLLEPKMADGRYQLTSFGKEMLSGGSI